MKESNARVITKTLAALSLLAPASAYPLGIGDIKLHSALNQNLNAEISLVLSEGEKLSDIKVNLAPPDKFDEAGLPWNAFLSKIKFEPTVRSDGSIIIRLSSREALKEPFLGLLLEVSWPKGSLYREFSVLVDPPQVYEQPTIPVVNLPEPMHSHQNAAMPGDIDSRSVPRNSDRVSTVTGQFGPTSRNDTLWKIAERTSEQRNVSVEQMMIAIYQENPRAFFKENINALGLGKVLKIPEREAILKVSRKQALAEYEQHMRAWENRKVAANTEMAVTEKTEQPVNEDQKIDNHLKLEAPSDASILENAVITPGQEQADGTKETQEESTASIDNQTDSSAGNSEANDELHRKVSEMQQQLAKMQELMALKDQQLADLKKQTEVQSVAQSSSQVPPIPPLKQDSPDVQAKKPIAQSTSQAKAEPADTKSGDNTTAPPSPPQSQPVFQDESESDPFYWTLGSFGLGLLAVLGWLWWRKRKIDARTDSESMFAPSIITKAVQSKEQEKGAPIIDKNSDTSDLYHVESVGESSFLSEFTPSDFDAFDSDQGEIDPVSEADVYLAYGRYQQAEELIRQAIKDHPEHDQCKLKLLEIFSANQNKSAFEAYVNELALMGKKADVGFWEKVTEMGNEICPDAVVFSSDADSLFSVQKESENDAISNVNLAKTNDRVLTDFESEDAKIKASISFDHEFNDDFTSDSAAPDIEVFGFDLSLNADEDIIEKDEEQHNNEVMEFDIESLSGFDIDSVSHRDYKKPVENSVELFNDDELESFDFNVAAVEPENDAVEAAAGLDFSIDDLDSNESPSLTNDLSFDLSPDKEEQNDLFGVSDLTDMDEFETKLDLARAYMDMGDEESAKEIVEQVLEKGSDDQKKVAQKIFGI